MPKNLNVSVLIDFYGEMLTDKQRELVTHYYHEDLSLAEIAENEGITRQGVRDAIKRAESQLFEMEDKLKFVQKYQESAALLERIRAATVEISEYNLRYGCSREINEKARSIYELAGEIA